MDALFRSYLDPAFRYVNSQNPARVRSREDALRDGLNCVALAHLVIRDLFGYALPPGFQSLELFSDLAHFEPVAAVEGMEAGDLVWFGVACPAVRLEDFAPRFRDGELLNFGDFPVNHVAVCTGDRDNGDPLLLHASYMDGTNAVWALSKFRAYERYGKIYAIRRLRQELRQEFRVNAATA